VSPTTQLRYPCLYVSSTSVTSPRPEVPLLPIKRGGADDGRWCGLASGEVLDSAERDAASEVPTAVRRVRRSKREKSITGSFHAGQQSVKSGAAADRCRRQRSFHQPRGRSLGRAVRQPRPVTSPAGGPTGSRRPAVAGIGSFISLHLARGSPGAGAPAGLPSNEARSTPHPAAAPDGSVAEELLTVGVCVVADPVQVLPRVLAGCAIGRHRVPAASVGATRDPTQEVCSEGRRGHALHDRETVVEAQRRRPERGGEACLHLLGEHRFEVAASVPSSHSAP
jgi:hypothetical protein